MERKSFHQHLQDDLHQPELSEAQLQTLRALGRDQDLDEPQNARVRGFQWLVDIRLLAACLMLGFALVWALQPANLVKDISYEVAANHLHLKPLDVRSSQLETIKSELSELKFNPVVSKRFSIAQSQLLGARYCSIQNRLAVQLRYQGEGNKSITLYQTAYDADRFSGLPQVERGDQPLQTYVRGMLVRIWVEKGLVFASVNE